MIVRFTSTQQRYTPRTASDIEKINEICRQAQAVEGSTAKVQQEIEHNIVQLLYVSCCGEPTL